MSDSSTTEHNSKQPSKQGSPLARKEAQRKGDTSQQQTEAEQLDEEAPQPRAQDSQHEEPPQRTSSKRTKYREIKAKEVGRRPVRRKSARRPLKQIRADACNLLSGDLLYRALEAMQRDAERAQPANLEDQQRLKDAAKTIRKLNLEQARIRKLLNRQNPRRQPDGEATGGEV